MRIGFNWFCVSHMQVLIGWLFNCKLKGKHFVKATCIPNNTLLLKCAHTLCHKRAGIAILPLILMLFVCWIISAHLVGILYIHNKITLGFSFTARTSFGLWTFYYLHRDEFQRDTSAKWLKYSDKIPNIFDSSGMCGFFSKIICKTTFWYLFGVFHEKIFSSTAKIYSFIT